MIYVAGRNNAKQLIAPSNNEKLVPQNSVHDKKIVPCICPPVKLEFNITDIKNISFGNEHTIVLMKDGKILAIGNTKGQYGGSDNQFLETLTEVDCFKDEVIEFIGCGFYYTLYTTKSKKMYFYMRHHPKIPVIQSSSEKLVYLSNGDLKASVIDDKGNMYLFADSKAPDGGFKVVTLDEAIVDACCCNTFVGVLTKTGKVYLSDAKGDNFKIVSTLEGKVIKRIFGYRKHCFALTYEGTVYGFGDNNNGQLGLSNNISRCVNEFIEITSIKHKINTIAVGNCHSLFLTQEGQLLSCGANMSGQLMTKNIGRDNFYIPTECGEIVGNITNIWCNAAASIVMVDHQIDGSYPSSLAVYTENTFLKSQISTNKTSKDDSKFRKFNTPMKKKASEKFQDFIKRKYEIKKKIKHISQDDINELQENSQIIKETSNYKEKEVVYSNQLCLMQIYVLETNSDQKKAMCEIEMLQNFQHPCLIKMAGFFFSSPNAVILLKKEPYTLQSYLKNNISNTRKVCLIIEILFGVKFLHDNCIIHRNLKPDNILVNKNGHVKITGFRYAQIDEIERSMKTDTTAIEFTAPELLEPPEDEDGSFELNQKADQYSIGVIIYFILTNGTTPKITFQDIMHRRPFLFQKTINNNGKMIIHNCCSFDLKQRPLNQDLLRELKSINYQLFDDVDPGAIEKCLCDLETEEELYLS